MDEGLVDLLQLAGAEGVIHPPAHRAQPAHWGGQVAGVSTMGVLGQGRPPQVPLSPPQLPCTHVAGCRPSASPGGSSASPRRTGTTLRHALHGRDRDSLHRCGQTPVTHPEGWMAQKGQHGCHPTRSGWQ